MSGKRDPEKMERKKQKGGIKTREREGGKEMRSGYGPTSVLHKYSVWKNRNEPFWKCPKMNEALQHTHINTHAHVHTCTRAHMAAHMYALSETKGITA